MRSDAVEGGVIRSIAPLAAIAGIAACAAGPRSDESPTPRPAPEGVAAPAAQEPPPTTTATRPATGQNITVSRLYRDNCQNCHGANGEGGGAGTASLISAEKFRSKWDRPFFEAILNGVPDRAMPAYAETMTDAEIWGLVVHLRELQKRGLRDSGQGLYADSATPHRTRQEEVVAQGKGLRTPWSLGFLPDGGMLVTNRSGELFRIVNGDLRPISGVPESSEVGQGGLMEVAPHPTNGWIYLSLADPLNGDRRRVQTKIVRGKLVGDRWTATQTIFRAPDDSYTGAGVHFGSKIVFDKKGHVFFSIGERATMIQAQDPEKSTGKVYRVNDDGSLPKDNPFAGRGPVAGAVWTMGHRNPQGLTLDLQGNLWDTEHGPRGGDELNLLSPGRNYGWPTRAWSINYDDRPFNSPWPTAEEKIESPVERWLPSIGASGLDVYRGKAFPKWRGDLLAGGLSGTNVDRFRIKNGKVVEHEEVLLGAGRVRDVRVGPDGFVYVVLNGPDKIVRLVPGE